MHVIIKIIVSWHKLTLKFLPLNDVSHVPRMHLHWSFLFTSSRSLASEQPQTQPTEQRRCFKHQPVRTKLYGYVLSDEWITNYANQHQLGAAHNMDAASKVFNKIIPAAGLTRVYTVRWDSNPPVCEVLTLAVGHRKRSGEVKMASKDRIERVKEVLGEKNDPSWCEMCWPRWLFVQTTRQWALMTLELDIGANCLLDGIIYPLYPVIFRSVCIFLMHGRRCWSLSQYARPMAYIGTMFSSRQWTMVAWHSWIVSMPSRPWDFHRPSRHLWECYCQSCQ